MVNEKRYPKVSIIIPHYNGIELISECLESLAQTDYPNLETIVVDNASQDKSVEFITEKFPSTNLIKSKTNHGFAGGCNLGVKSATGEYIVILNNDTIQEKDWLKPLIKLIESNINISSVQPKILNYYDKSKFDYAGGSGGYIDYLVFPFARGRIFDTVESDTGQYNNATKIFWASGTAFITRKTIFDSVGGFDEDLFAHFEEIDYHWKCHLMGYNVWVEPKSVVYHKGGATLSDTSPFKTYLNHRNSLILLLTNYQGWRGLLLSFPRMMLEGVSFLKEVFAGRFDHAFAHVKAKSWIIFHPNIIIKRRQLIKQIAKLNNTQLSNKIYKKSIVIEYFLRKKTEFNKIK
jgi:GT2 family glycosyltransferase